MIRLHTHPSAADLHCTIAVTTQIARCIHSCVRMVKLTIAIAKNWLYLSVRITKPELFQDANERFVSTKYLVFAIVDFYRVDVAVITEPDG